MGVPRVRLCSLQMRGRATAPPPETGPGMKHTVAGERSPAAVAMLVQRPNAQRVRGAGPARKTFVRRDHGSGIRASWARAIQAFVTWLAVERNVPASTQNQALCALLFLDHEVLRIGLPRIEDAVRPTLTARTHGAHPATRYRWARAATDLHPWAAWAWQSGMAHCGHSCSPSSRGHRAHRTGR
jgi:Phage integrase, N-terminal SAM-like domain